MSEVAANVPETENELEDTQKGKFLTFEIDVRLRFKKPMAERR